jgi:hypothetical protein
MANPSPDKVAAAIAEADFFGDRRACQRFGISSRTIQRWRHRAKQDPVLAADVASKKKMLLEKWQADASQPLSVALEELARRMPLAETAVDAKVIFAIAGTVKILGELKLSAVLLDE